MNHLRPVVRGDLSSSMSFRGLTMDVDGSVDLKRSRLDVLPIKFGHVSGDFWVDDNQLISLIGAPESVAGDFSCESNGLLTLLHGPSSVGGDYFCSANQLTDLAHLPTHMGGGLFCSNNKITSLAGIPKKLKQLHCDYNPISSLMGIAFVLQECEVIDLSGCPIIKGGLGLLNIKSLKEIHAENCGDFSQAAEIISAFCGKGKIGIYTCAERLKAARLGHYVDL